MKKPLLVILLSVFMYGVGLAQPRADFTFKNTGLTSCSGVPAAVYFFNTSTLDSGQSSFTSVQYTFGDGTPTVNGLGATSIGHIYTTPGVYSVRLVVADATGSDSTTQAVVINSLTVTYSKSFLPYGCAGSTVRLLTSVKSAVPDDSISYNWVSYTGRLHSQSGFNDSVLLIDYDTMQQRGDVSYTVTSKYGNRCYGPEEVFPITPGSPIVPTNGASALTANRSCVGEDGWTNYFYDPGTPGNENDDSLVLSLQLGFNDIGSFGDGTFSVSTYATPGAGTNTAILLTNPLITNGSGYWVMNRYWQVTPTRQPIQPVGVRFYFNNQDINDINGSYPTHDADFQSLIFYRTYGGNPDPTTNLAGAQAISSLTYNYAIAKTDTAQWRDYDYSYNSALYMHVAEFHTGFLSGGGGGITGDRNVLPVQLTSFTAANNGNKVNLQWTIAQEINVSKYNVQVSADGRQFTTLGSVIAHGKTSPDTYTFSYEETGLSKAYYRLLTIEKNGTQTSSNIVPLLFNRVTNNVMLYPNPAKNSVQVKAAMFENKWATADIYNSAGTKVSSAKLYFNAGLANLNTSALASGHYTIVLRNEQSVTHSPLVIVK